MEVGVFKSSSIYCLKVIFHYPAVVIKIMYTKIIS